MLRMTLHVDGKPDYTLVLPADEKYLDAVKAYLDINVFADAMIEDIYFKAPYEVVDIQVISPDDVDAIKIQEGRDLVTLLTCHPYGTGGRYRLVVYCERNYD